MTSPPVRGDLVGVALLRARLDDDELRLLAAALGGRGHAPGPRHGRPDAAALVAHLRDLAGSDPAHPGVARAVRAYCDGAGRTPRAAAELLGTTERQALGLLAAARAAEGLDATVSGCPGWALVLPVATGRADRLSAGERAAAEAHERRCARCAGAAPAAAASAAALVRPPARSGLGGLVRR